MKKQDNRRIKYLCYGGYIFISLLFLILFLGMLPREFDMSNKSVLVIITFLINFIFFVGFLIIHIKKHPFSFASIMWIFNIVFFFMAPMIQYLHSKWPWDLEFQNISLIRANIYILLFSVVYECAYLLIGFKKKYKINYLEEAKIIISVKNHNRLKLLTLATLIFVALIVIRLDFKDLFSKNLYSRAFNIMGNDSLSSLLLTFAQYYTALIFLINLNNVIKGKKIDIFFLVASLSFIVVCFPFALTRFVLATIYLGIYLIITKKNKYLNSIFIPLFIFAILIIFPSINSLKYYYSILTSEFYGIKDLLKAYRSQYFLGHYDAYSNLVATIEYTNNYGPTYGFQLLGALCFFIPRAVWKSKPVGSGAFLAQQTNMNFSNIAMPFIGEGIINFGFFGLVLFAVVLGALSKVLDSCYWNNRNRHINILYPFLMNLSFFMLRGDLMTSIFHLVMLVGSYGVINIFLNFGNKKVYCK